MRAGVILAFAVVASLACPAVAQETEVLPPHISWQVENPFRLFNDPSATELFRQTYKSLSSAEQNSPVLAAERRLEALFPHGWAKSIYSETCWRSSKNRYGPCKAGEDYINPREHRVSAKLEGIGPGATDCEWAIAPPDAAVVASSSDVVRINKPCDSAVQLDIPFPNGARVGVSIGGSPIAEVVVKVQDLFVVGIGDSFGSGEGNPDDPVEFSADRDVTYGSSPGGTEMSGYPARVGDWSEIGEGAFIESGARWHNQACHRSLYSYQLRAGLELAIENPHRAVTYVGFACAGAEIVTGLFQPFKGTEWAPHPPDFPQISAVATAQCAGAKLKELKVASAYSIGGKVADLTDVFIATCPRAKSRAIDLLFVSIGGNDIGFSSFVANAVLPDGGTLRMLGGWMGQVSSPEQAAGKFEALTLRYKALNRAIHANLHVPWAESDRIVLTAYPVMALLEDGRRVCPDGKAGTDVFPDFVLSAGAIAKTERLGDQLNNLMWKSAAAYGWTFVDDHRYVFAGHAVCEGSTDPNAPITEQLALPRLAGGLWTPYNPSLYQPYAPRKRWFRTPNDAFLTGNFHLASNVLRDVLRLDGTSWFQVLLASTYSGAFHPTAEGQAAIADAVVAKSREVLKRHGQEP